MAVSFVASGEVEIVDASISATQTLNLNSGAAASIQPGDVLVLAPNQGVNGNTMVSTPSGSVNRVTVSSPGSGSIVSGVYTYEVPTPKPSSISFVWSAADDGSLCWSAWRGVDASGIQASTSGWAGASATSSAAPSITTSVNGCRLVAGVDIASGSEVVTPEAGGTIICDGDERNGIMADFGTQSTAGATGTKTFSWPTSGAYRPRAWMVTLPPAPVPDVLYANVGATTDDGFTVAVRVENADEVQIRVGSVTGDAAEVDENGWAHASVSGLDADTVYSYDIILDGSVELEDFASTRTFPAEGTPVSFGFAFASCFNPTAISGTDEGSFDRILARDPVLWIHGGDYHYEDNTSTSTSSHIADMEKSLAYSEGLRDLHAAAPVLYSPGDHDYGGNNVFPGSYTNATRAAKLAVMPFYDRPDSTALYHAVVYGRVRFIMCDTRSKAVEDTTRLGSTQLAWLEAQLQEPEPVKFVWVDNCWIDQRPTDPGDDTWEHFSDERDTIAGYIAAAVGQVIIIHGDQHCLAADDGSGNPFGGVPVVSGAPFKQNASHKTVNGNSDWSEGSWPTSGTAGVEQYMWVDVTDEDTDTITVNFTGYDTSDVARVTLEVVVPVVEEITGTLEADLPTVSIDVPTVSWSGTYTNPVYSGTLTATLPEVTVDVPTVTWSGTVTAPVYEGELAADLPTVTIDAPTVEWEGTFTPPEYAGTLEADLPAVTVGVPTVSWTGTFTPPGSNAGTLEADLPEVAIGVPTVAWSGTYTDPVYTGELDATLPAVTIGAPTVEWEGSYTPPQGGVLVATLPEVTIGVPTVEWSGTYRDPITGTLDATLPAVTIGVPTVVWFGTTGGVPPVPRNPMLFEVARYRLSQPSRRILTERE